jgi:hypothetical protein
LEWRDPILGHAEEEEEEEEEEQFVSFSRRI